MTEVYGRKRVIQVGRHRLMVRFGWPYRIGLHRTSHGVWCGGFKVGVFNYVKRSRS